MSEYLMRVVSLTIHIPRSNKNLYRLNLGLSRGQDNPKKSRNPREHINTHLNMTIKFLLSGNKWHWWKLEITVFKFVSFQSRYCRKKMENYFLVWVNHPNWMKHRKTLFNFLWENFDLLTSRKPVRRKKKKR